MEHSVYFKAEFCSQTSEKIQNPKITQFEADQKSLNIKTIKFSKAIPIIR